MNSILNRFCSNSTDVRDYLRKPFRLNGYIYATNGHIAVRVIDDGSFKEEAHSQVTGIEKYFNETINNKYIDFPSLPDPEKCHHCDGTGKQKAKVACDECDGEGEFLHGSHWYSCNECDGDGVVSSKNIAGSEPCDHCGGTGEQKMQPVKAVGNLFIARRYIELMMQLPDVSLFYADDCPYFSFKFTGGEGIYMAMRV